MFNLRAGYECSWMYFRAMHEPQEGKAASSRGRRGSTSFPPSAPSRCIRAERAAGVWCHKSDFALLLLADLSLFQCCVILSIQKALHKSQAIFRPQKMCWNDWKEPLVESSKKREYQRTLIFNQESSSLCRFPSSDNAAAWWVRGIFYGLSSCYCLQAKCEVR